MPVDFIGIFTLLTEARVRFVVVGGLALLLHGLDRLTADVDLVLDLSIDATADAVRTLTASGYRSMAPVNPMELADPARRAEWQTSRGMKVFSFWDSTNARPTVDVMLDPVVSFSDLYESATVMTVGGTPVRVASIPHLIALKQAAGRPQDHADIERLRALRGS
jgi:hypothetical protein